jgi:hypothetical protein
VYVWIFAPKVFLVLLNPAYKLDIIGKKIDTPNLSWADQRLDFTFWVSSLNYDSCESQLDGRTFRDNPVPTIT